MLGGQEDFLSFPESAGLDEATYGTLGIGTSDTGDVVMKYLL